MDVDVSATRDYYNSITDSALCNCGYCRNYRLQIKSALPEVAAYLDSLGIDIKRFFDVNA